MFENCLNWRLLPVRRYGRGAGFVGAAVVQELIAADRDGAGYFAIESCSKARCRQFRQQRLERKRD
jgi:hypothetical protein